MPKRERRKLTTIFAADVAGYSRLMGADEEGTMRRLRALRAELIEPVIQVNRGRIVKTAGDGILIEFASVVDAMRCSLEMQRGLAVRNADFVPEKRIEFRVGIHLGDVMVQPDGDLFGDGVNIAARLETMCEPGGVCLSRAAYEQVEGKIAERFTDLGDKELKNIARPVRVFAVDVGGKAKSPNPSAGTGEASSPRPTVPAPPRLSIVVLPFANFGGNPEQEYFVDGVTDSLTTDLSRISGSFVIARNTAFTYKGKVIDVKDIGRDLNVRYVLEGSVQRGDSRLRVNVQLIDAETGNHLWAERFDKPLADLFDMSDEIVARLARQLDTELIAAEARRAVRAPHPDSMDLYFQGAAVSYRSATPKLLSRAREFYERALALDPNNTDALVGLASIDCYIGAGFMADDRAARLAAAETAALRALSVVPNHAGAHFILGTVHITTNRAALGLSECEHALTLDRNLAAAHASIGVAKRHLGRTEETEGHIVEALRLSPRDTQAFLWLWMISLAKLNLGDDEAAAVAARRSIEVNRNFPAVHFTLAAALAQLGRRDEARAATQAGLTLDPKFTIRRFRDGTSSDNPTYIAQRERIIEGMRKAGLPEG